LTLAAFAKCPRKRGTWLIARGNKLCAVKPLDCSRTGGNIFIQGGEKMREFQLFHAKLQYTQERLNYFEFYDFCVGMIRDAEAHLRKSWKEAGSLDRIYDHYNDKLAEAIGAAANKTTNYLNAAGVYSYTSELLMKQSKKGYQIFQDFQEMVEGPYEKIEIQLRGEAEFRKLRKKTRAKYRGFGWDMGSQIVNSTKAAAKNAVTGLGHTAMNAVGNAMSSMKAADEKGKIYRDKEIVDILCEDMTAFINEMADIAQNAIERETDIRIDRLADGERKRASALSQNILEGRVPEEKIRRAAVESLIIWPFNSSLYRFLIDRYGDAGKEIEAMGKTFRFDAAAYKKQKLEEAYAGLLKKKFAEEQELLEKKREVLEYSAYMGVEDEKYTAYLDQEWSGIDRRIRTVEGEEYATREEAAQVEDDIKTFDVLLGWAALENRNMLDAGEYEAALQLVKGAKYKNPRFAERVERRFAVQADKVIAMQKVRDRMRNENVKDAIRAMVAESAFAPAVQNYVRYTEYQDQEKPLFEDGLQGLPLLYLDVNGSTAFKKFMFVTTEQIGLMKRAKNKILSIEKVESVYAVKKTLHVMLMRGTQSGSAQAASIQLEWCKLGNFSEDAVREMAEFLNRVILSIQKIGPLELEKDDPVHVYGGDPPKYTEEDWTIVKNLKISAWGLASFFLALAALGIGAPFGFLPALAAVGCGIAGWIPVRNNRIPAAAGCIMGGYLAIAQGVLLPGMLMGAAEGADRAVSRSGAAGNASDGSSGGASASQQGVFGSGAAYPEEEYAVIYAENGYAEGGMGDVMRTYFFDYTVNSAYLCRSYKGYTPVPEYIFLAVDVTVTNTSDQSITMYDTDFQVQWDDPAEDAYDVPFTYYLETDTVIDSYVLPAEYTLERNESRQGLLLFEVPDWSWDFSVSYVELFDDDSEGDTFFTYFAPEYDAYRLYGEVLAETYQAYGSCNYALYDLDKDGTEELIVQTGEIMAELMAEVYTVSYSRAVSMGTFYGGCGLYEAEDGNGIYAVEARQGFERVDRLSKEIEMMNDKYWPSLVVEKLWAKDPVEEYYENEHPIEYQAYVYGGE